MRPCGDTLTSDLLALVPQWPPGSLASLWPSDQSTDDYRPGPDRAWPCLPPAGPKEQ